MEIVLGNVALAELYQYFSQSVRRSLRVSLLDCSLPEPDHAAHAAIVEAIRARDPEAAARAAAARSEQHTSELQSQR